MVVEILQPNHFKNLFYQLHSTIKENINNNPETTVDGWYLGYDILSHAKLWVALKPRKSWIAQCQLLRPKEAKADYRQLSIQRLTKK